MEWDQIHQSLTLDRNDRVAWRALQERVERWARAVLQGRCEHTIDDAVADTCLAVLIGFDGARGAETFAGFVYGHFLNVRRRLLRPGQTLELVLEDFDVAEPDEDEGPDPGTLERLQSALDALPARERRAITLRYFEEHSSSEIGVALGVTRGNARRIVFNALRGLRAHFAEPALASR